MLQITLLTMARLKCLNEWCMILKAFFYLFLLAEEYCCCRCCVTLAAHDILY